jgi:hypothetical protein
VRTLVDMEGSYLSANFFREIVAAESFSYDPSRPKPQFVTLAGARSGQAGGLGPAQEAAGARTPERRALLPAPPSPRFRLLPCGRHRLPRAPSHATISRGMPPPQARSCSRSGMTA